jgi:hypothetical protein
MSLEKLARSTILTGAIVLAAFDCASAADKNHQVSSGRYSISLKVAKGDYKVPDSIDLESSLAFVKMVKENSKRGLWTYSHRDKFLIYDEISGSGEKESGEMFHYMKEVEFDVTRHIQIIMDSDLYRSNLVQEVDAKRKQQESRGIKQLESPVMLGGKEALSVHGEAGDKKMTMYLIDEDKRDYMIIIISRGKSSKGDREVDEAIKGIKFFED